MKKMMMVLALLMLTVNSVSAATVAWNTGAISAPLPGGTFGAVVGSTTGIYLATATFFADVAGVQGGALVGVTGNTDNSTSVASVLNAAAGGFTFLNNGSYWAQVEVVSTDGKWKMTSTSARFTIGGTGNGSINFLAGTGFNTVANKMPTSWTAVVPEPTSMALLALGVAAVGLRRRFRK
jgi:hypothetical protein